MAVVHSNKARKLGRCLGAKRALSMTIWRVRGRVCCGQTRKNVFERKRLTVSERGPQGGALGKAQKSSSFLAIVDRNSRS
jgi:hypothetical protein